MTDEELKELVASLAVSQVKTDVELKTLVAGLAVSNAELTIKFDRTDAQIQMTSDSVKRVNKTVGSITNNNGSITEEYFYNSLKAKPILGEITYDKVKRNISGNVS